jgi:ribosomal protein S18 acetylase RimI-like enzyme
VPVATLQPRCRFATEADIPSLKRIDPWPRDHQWRRKVAEREAVVVEEDRQIAAMARYEVLWTTVPFLSYIYVAEAFRRRGYSRIVLEFLGHYLVEQGYVALLSSSQTDDPASQAWHVHMGFQENGIIENIADAGIGEIVYRVELASHALPGTG